MSPETSYRTVAIAATAFAAGLGVASISRRMERKKRNKYKADAGATVEGRDLSLFYSDDKDSLKVIPESKKFLPADLYSRIVRDCIVCCVDCLIVRENLLSNRKECLLVERASEPVKGVWWLPGGRMYKGETFFEGAVRKAKEETGLDGAKAIQVLGVYNTFFPTSHWDTKEEKGTQTIQPIVLVELNAGSEVLLDSTSERYRWIGLDPDAAEKDKEDKYVVEALRRLKAWDETYC